MEKILYDYNNCSTGTINVFPQNLHLTYSMGINVKHTKKKFNKIYRSTGIHLKQIHRKTEKWVIFTKIVTGIQWKNNEYSDLIYRKHS
jgi:hypothetical protein